MVHRTQHLQNAFKWHPYDAFHACDKILCIICGYICPESQLPQLLICFRDLTGGADHNFRLAGIDDPVVMEMRRCDIPNMVIYRKNLISVNGHRIPGQVSLRIIKCQVFSLKNPDGNAGEISDGRAKIGQIDLHSVFISFWSQLYRTSNKNASGAVLIVLY